MTRISRVILYFCIILLGAAAVPAQAEIRAVELTEPEDLPGFALTDHQGQPFTQQDFKGHWSLILIGYTQCPDVCPFVLTNLAEVMSQMSVRVRPDKLPHVVFVAIDPGRDQAILADYVTYFDPNFIGVTGDPSELSKFVEGIDGFYRIGKADKEGEYEVQHSASVVVIAPDGRIQAKLSPPLAPGEVAEYLTRKQIAYARQKKQ